MVNHRQTLALSIINIYSSCTCQQINTILQRHLHILSATRSKSLAAAAVIIIIIIIIINVDAATTLVRLGLTSLQPTVTENVNLCSALYQLSRQEHHSLWPQLLLTYNSHFLCINVNGRNSKQWNKICLDKTTSSDKI